MIGVPTAKLRAGMIGVKNPRRLRTFWAGMVPTVASKTEGRYRNARREERREQDAVWATDLIDDFFPMDDKAQIEHDKRQDDRRARERRAEDRRQAQVSADDVEGWNGDDRPRGRPPGYRAP